jgi:hypothetical protein
MPTMLPESCLSLVRIQSGVLSRNQALDNGLPPDVVDRYVRSGRWQIIQRGVYCVFNGPLAREATLWAAVHRAGPGAVLSHETAAELFKLTDQASSLIHLTIPENRRVSRIPGVALHYSSQLADAVHPSQLPPRTRIEQTVLDLAGQATSFDAAFDVACQACQRGLTVPARIAEAMDKRSRQRWRRELTLALRDVSAGVHSVLEYRYVHKVERPHGLPEAIRQARVIDGKVSRYLDNLYSDYGLCVELDGQQAHPEHQRWADQRRLNAIAEQGISTLRYGWVDIDRRACQVAAQVVGVLRRLGWTGSPHSCGIDCQARRKSGTG